MDYTITRPAVLMSARCTITNAIGHRSRILQPSMAYNRTTNLQNSRSTLATRKRTSPNFLSSNNREDREPKRDLSWTVVWSMTVIICAVICGYQTQERIGHFLSLPVGANVKLIRNTTIQFPAFTICPALPYRYVNLFKLFLSKGIDKKKYVYALIEEGFLNVSEFYNWASFATGSQKGTGKILDFIIILAQSQMMAGAGASIQPTLRNVSTFIGKCLTASFEKPVLFRGPATSFMISSPQQTNITKTVLAKLVMDSDKIYMIYVHDKEVSPVHTAPTSSFKVIRGHKTGISLSVKEYKLLRRSTFLCVTQEEYEKCAGDCLAKKFLGQVTCRFPMDFPQLSHLPICATYKSFNDFLYKSFKAYYDIAGTIECTLKCPKTCFERVYITNVQYMAKTAFELAPDMTEIVFYFAENVYEQVEEYFTYSIISLLCDMGGNLGLFLGFSFLTLLDILRCFSEFAKRAAARL